MTLNMEKQSFDSIIEQHFPKDIQQKRIRKELLSLNELNQEAFRISLLNSALGLKVIVELSLDSLEKDIQDSQNIHHPVIFELLLDPQFPFNLPKLFCQTNIYEPSLADGRDFLEETIEKTWSPTILLREVIGTLPQFLRKVMQLQRPEDSQSLGKYHLGDLYNLEDLLGYESIILFSGEEALVNKKLAPRYLMVAESHFLIFETVEKTKNILRLLDYANIRAVINLKKGKEEDRSIVLTIADKEKQGGVVQYKFVLNEASKLMEILISMGQKYGVKVSGASKRNFDIAYYSARLAIPVDEDNIEEVLEDINDMESKLETQISKEVVYTLMAYYQKVVEHFANYDDPLVGEYVGKLRSLMEREDVQNTLNSTDEEQKVIKQEPKKLTEDTDIDEEEKKEGNDRPFDWPEKAREVYIEEYSRPEQREEIFIRDNRENQPRNEERVKKANLPPQDDEFGEYEENNTKESQPEEKLEKHEIPEDNHNEVQEAVEQEKLQEAFENKEEVREVQEEKREKEIDQQEEVNAHKEEIRETEEIRQKEPEAKEEETKEAREEENANLDNEKLEEVIQQEEVQLEDFKNKEETVEPGHIEQPETKEENLAAEVEGVVEEKAENEARKIEQEEQINLNEEQEAGEVKQEEPETKEEEAREEVNADLKNENVEEEIAPKEEAVNLEGEKQDEVIQEAEPKIEAVENLEEAVEPENIGQPEAKEEKQEEEVAQNKEQEQIQENQQVNENEQKEEIEEKPEESANVESQNVEENKIEENVQESENNQNNEEEKEGEKVEEKNEAEEKEEGEDGENESPEKTDEAEEVEEKKEGGAKKNKKKKNKKR